MSYPLCRHVKTNGTRCGSPALTGQTFCYFHTRLHKRHRALRNAARHVPAANPPDASPNSPKSAEILPFDLNLPPLEDAEAIQVSISLVLQAIALGRLELPRARAVLYALQLASQNIRNARLQPYPGNVLRDTAQTKSGLDLSAQSSTGC